MAEPYSPQSKSGQQTASPLVSPDYDWTGIYGGLEVGGGLGSSRRNFNQFGTTTGDFTLRSVLGGITAGANKQFGHIVLGVEGDLSSNGVWGGTNHPTTSFHYFTENTWLTTIRPRMGYSFGSIMPYVTGGFAAGDVRTATYNHFTGIAGSDYVRTEPGWVAGGGIETELSPHWSIKAEYLYTQLCNADGPSSTGAPSNASFNEQIGRVGLNYKFGPGSPQATSAPISTHASSQPRPLTLRTPTGFEVGGQISEYRYQEHVVANTDFIRELGGKLGITATATKAFENAAFVGGDFRFAFGSNHYQGSGSQNGIPEYLWDIRALGGKDFVINNNISLTPHSGVGYRNLFNDWSGHTSVGASGYRRDSQYYYLPVGLTPRFRIDSNSRVSTNLEYDQLLEGLQSSHLTDVYSGFPNLINNQFQGYGLRGSIMYERVSWSVGPFMNYWNIDRSAEVVKNGVYYYEPHNQTLEAGLQAKYRF